MVKHRHPAQLELDRKMEISTHNPIAMVVTAFMIDAGYNPAYNRHCQQVANRAGASLTAIRDIVEGKRSDHLERATFEGLIKALKVSGEGSRQLLGQVAKQQVPV